MSLRAEWVTQRGLLFSLSHLVITTTYEIATLTSMLQVRSLSPDSIILSLACWLNFNKWNRTVYILLFLASFIQHISVFFHVVIVAYFKIV